MTRYLAGSSGGRSDSGNNGEGGHGDRDEEEDGGDYTESGASSGSDTLDYISCWSCLCWMWGRGSHIPPKASFPELHSWRGLVFCARDGCLCGVSGDGAEKQVCC